jgi:hypothetical protein
MPDHLSTFTVNFRVAKICRSLRRQSRKVFFQLGQSLNLHFLVLSDLSQLAFCVLNDLRQTVFQFRRFSGQRNIFRLRRSGFLDYSFCSRHNSFQLSHQFRGNLARRLRRGRLDARQVRHNDQRAGRQLFKSTMCGLALRNAAAGNFFNVDTGLSS